MKVPDKGAWTWSLCWPLNTFPLPPLPLLASQVQEVFKHYLCNFSCTDWPVFIINKSTDWYNFNLLEIMCNFWSGWLLNILCKHKTELIDVNWWILNQTSNSDRNKSGNDNTTSTEQIQWRFSVSCSGALILSLPMCMERGLDYQSPDSTQIECGLVWSVLLSTMSTHHHSGQYAVS